MSGGINGNTSEIGGVFLLSWTVLGIAILVTAPVKLDIRIIAAPALSFQCEISLYFFTMRFGGLINGRFIASIRNSNSPLSFSQMASFFKSLYDHAASRRVEISCLIGTGDACHTGIVVGGILSVIRCFTFSSAKISVTPDFQNAAFRASARCILCFRGGDIMVAGMRAVGGQLPRLLKGLKGNG